MSDSPPVAEQALPQPERGDPPAYPMSADQLMRVEHMSALLLQNLIASSSVELSSKRAAEVAVELAMDIANEVRQYRLVDGRAVKVKPPEDTNG